MRFEKRLGKVSVDRKLLICNEEEARAMLSDFLVLHSNSNFATDEITYYGTHPEFDPIEEGMEAPRYKAIVSSDGVEWVKE